MTHRIIIVGASGYIGSQLIPLLLEQGHQVIACARNISYLTDRVQQHPNLRCEYLDLEDKTTIGPLLSECDIGYFLVHGMSHGHDFINYEISLAQNFADAAKQSQLKRIIYLSALQPENHQSQHLLARQKTGEILRSTGITTIEIQSGIIIGAGSAALEIMTDFINHLPIILCPKWIHSQANPIAIDNLNDYLIQSLDIEVNDSLSLEAGGPDTVTYLQLFNLLAKRLNKSIKIIPTRFVSPKFAGLWLGIITSVPSELGRALLAGIDHDLLADNSKIQQLMPQTLTPLPEALKLANHTSTNSLQGEIWGFDPSALRRWQPDYGYYPKQAGASFTTNASANSLWKVILRLGGPEGYFFANGLWRTREWLDPLLGGSFPIRRKPKSDQLQLGDYIDSWKVIRCENNEFLSLLFGMTAPGLGRLEFSIKELENNTRELDVRAWWHPKGFWGLMYWFAMFPAHLFIFKGMVKAICKKAEKEEKG
ncbi:MULTISPECIES: DUF2867 domain-containing protein [Aliivibrio]|uniref:DUF2867 domain-containing protein n=1 Tax=Aliivibrio TaxID=511678 RepID=UPI001681C18A|nr:MULTISPECIES: DUF2867 domain-containing protein [Aliivibrio]MBD1568157.1 SDR family oxidoreductase [Aliivibrio sp. S10_S31]MCE4934021.1 SDR family oxidoreductase [Aliivibrio fischeri]